MDSTGGHRLLEKSLATWLGAKDTTCSPGGVCGDDISAAVWCEYYWCVPFVKVGHAVWQDLTVGVPAQHFTLPQFFSRRI